MAINRISTLLAKFPEAGLGEAQLCKENLFVFWSKIL